MPTSATGSDLAAGAVARRCHRRQRRTTTGFTLIELIVVLAIAALLAGASAVAYPRFKEATQYRSTVRGVLSALISARAAAQRSGRSSAFFVDLKARSYGVDERVLGRFPDSLEVRFIIAQRELDTDQRGAVRFYASGSSTGGSVDIARTGRGGVRLRVDWLLGRVTQDPLQ